MAALLPAEQLRMALQMECRGQGLYLRAMKLTQDDALRALLKELAQEEAVHYELFSAMLENFAAPDFESEREQLAASLASEAFYPGGLMQVSGEGALASREAMLEAAIRAEQDSIAYYTNMLPGLNEASAATVRRIIHEEEGHLRALFERRSK